MAVNDLPFIVSRSIAKLSSRSTCVATQFFFNDATPLLTYKATEK